jgi:flotillin
MLGNGSNGSNGVGFGKGLAGQLLAYQANKPILDEVLSSAGFKNGGNAVDTLLGAAGAGNVNAKPAPESAGLPQSEMAP